MIFETIVTTINADDSVHVAPMGVRREGEHHVIAPFRPSATLENLQRSGEAVMNLCDDVRVFAGCVTGRFTDWPTRPADRVHGAVLQDTPAHVELRVDRVTDDEVRPRFHCLEVAAGNHRAFRGFNRAQAAVLEAAVLVSRLDRLPAEKIDSEVAYLMIAMEKTAGEKEKEAWEWLMQRIAAFRSAPRAESR